MLQSSSRRGATWLSVVAFLALAPRGLWAQARDITVESTQRLMQGIYSPTGETMQILAALRTTHDPVLLALFDRLGRDPSAEMQLYAMVSEVLITKDPARLSVPKLLKTTDQKLIGSALATLIDGNMINNDQLKQVMNDAPDAVQRVMAASELSRRGALTDHAALKNFLVNNKDEVRFYAAVTLLQSPEEADHVPALEALKAMSARHDQRTVPITTLMLVRVRNEKVRAAAPWVQALAGDDDNDDLVRQAAIGTLLALGRGEGSGLLGHMIAAEMARADQRTGQQIRLGLMALEFARQLQPAQSAPLAHSKDRTVQELAALAQKGADGVDPIPAFLKLLKEGHPLILDWALLYSDRTDADHARDIRLVIIGLATIVDEQRGRDYERAVLAAQKLAADVAPAGRKLFPPLLAAENAAVVEATLAGLLRSELKDQSELVLPVWPALNKSPALENAANYAALILAREGHRDPLPWLQGMVQGGTVQNIGFRTLAGWYYARLLNQTDAMLKQILAQPK